MMTFNHENNVRNLFCIPKNRGKEVLHTDMCPNVKGSIPSFAQKGVWLIMSIKNIAQSTTFSNQAQMYSKDL